MSHTVTCEVCGTTGQRGIMRMCPEGWFFGETADDETGEIQVVMACSEECTHKFWTRGPGRLTHTDQKETS